MRQRCADWVACHPCAVVRALTDAAALRDFGNTSASSTYYVLAYLESITGIKKGERVLQVMRLAAPQPVLL